MNGIAIIGILYCCIETQANIDDIFPSIFPSKEINDVNSVSMKKKPFSSHDSFDFFFPSFGDIFPMSGFQSRAKEFFNNFQSDKDSTILDDIDSSINPGRQIKSQRKSPKDKVVMSITELFIPFPKHKNKFEKEKKHEYSEDIFHGFPFGFDDFEPMERHDAMLTKNHQLNNKRKHEKIHNNKAVPGKLGGSDIFDFTSKIPNSGTPHNKSVKSESLIDKFIPEAFYLFHNFNNKIHNNSKGDLKYVCCSSSTHGQCKPDGHCQNAMCMARKSQRLTGEKDVKSLLFDRTYLFCTIPAILGLGTIAIAIEIIRRHKEIVKKTRFLPAYSLVQNC